MRFLSAAVPEAHDRNLWCPNWHATRRQLSVSVACAQGSSQWPTDRYGSSLFGRHPCLSKTRHEHEANLEQDASSLSLRSCLSRIVSRRDATWLPRPLLLIHTRREPAPPSGQHKNEQTPATQPEKYSVSHKSRATEELDSLAIYGKVKIWETYVSRFKCWKFYARRAVTATYKQKWKVTAILPHWHDSGTGCFQSEEGGSEGDTSTTGNTKWTIGLLVKVQQLANYYVKAATSP